MHLNFDLIPEAVVDTKLAAHTRSTVSVDVSPTGEVVNIYVSGIKLEPGNVDLHEFVSMIIGQQYLYRTETKG